MRVRSLRLQRVLLYGGAEIESSLLLHFREELEHPGFLVGLLHHVDESEQFLDADEDPGIIICISTCGSPATYFLAKL